jgi:hypothetical protein
MTKVYRTGWAALTLWLLACGAARAEYNGHIPTAPGNDPPLPIDGGWQEFQFGVVGSYDTEGAYTFTGPALLIVTDAFIVGDQFAVYDNGVLLGDTSVPNDTNPNLEVDNPNAAYANPVFSSGSWLLGPGDHSITIESIESPEGAGGAFLQAECATPEPATIVLLGLGAIGAAGIARRRRAQAA